MSGTRELSVDESGSFRLATWYVSTLQLVILGEILMSLFLISIGTATGSYASRIGKRGSRRG